MLLLTLLLIFVLLFFTIILIIFKRSLKEIFKSENYIKFVQLIIVGVLLFVFIAIFIYFWINKIEVNNMAVIFTVIVGWLGLIIGAFFGQKFMEGLTEKKEAAIEDMVSQLEDSKIQIDTLLDITDDYEEEIKMLQDLKK